MDLLSKEEIRNLITERDGLCVSIYLPTHRVESEQDPIRFKNLIKEARQKLLERDLTNKEVDSMLEEAQNLLDDKTFWQHQSDALAVFIDKEQTQVYRLPLENVEDLALVGDHFYVKPLMALLSGDGQFYVLALSQNQVRLFQATRYLINELELGDIPTSLAEALKYDVPERQIQFHTETGGGTGKRPAMFHGQGVGTDEAREKKDILEFFRQVDNGIRRLLHEDKTPVVLACVDYLCSIYREANSFANLMQNVVKGNPDEVKPQELHEKAWQIVAPLFERDKHEARDKYNQLAGTGKTSAEVPEIILAAKTGQVETLFVPATVHKWGRYDRDSGEIELYEGDGYNGEDLLDSAAMYTFMNGGTVYVVEPEAVPGDEEVAAVYRYA